MNTQYPKVDMSKLARGVLYSFSTSLALSFFISIILIINAIFNSPFQNNFGSGLFILFIWAFVAGLISLIASVFVGIPVTIILIKSGFDNEFISAAIGALLVLFTLYLFAGVDYSAIMFCLYGFSCAYGFMFGYKS
jgi:hypothetical protein